MRSLLYPAERQWHRLYKMYCFCWVLYQTIELVLRYLNLSCFRKNNSFRTEYFINDLSITLSQTIFRIQVSSLVFFFWCAFKHTYVWWMYFVSLIMGPSFRMCLCVWHYILAFKKEKMMDEECEDCTYLIRRMESLFKIGGTS